MIEIKTVKAHPRLQEVIPHGEPKCKGKLRYQLITNHITYNEDGEKIKIGRVNAYRCNVCGLIAFPPPVGRELDLRIAKEKSKRARITANT